MLCKADYASYYISNMTQVAIGNESHIDWYNDQRGHILR